MLELSRKSGLVKQGHVALDGTRVRAKGSKDKAMSKGRMKEGEEQLAGEVAELPGQAEEIYEEIDEEED